MLAHFQNLITADLLVSGFFVETITNVQVAPEGTQPMTISAEALRELHRFHRQLTDLRNRLELGPKQIRASEANVSRANDQVNEAKNTLTKAKVTTDDKQLQLKQREDRITELNNKLNMANSNKEYQALKEQIAADEQANSVLSDEILESLEIIDGLTATQAQAQAELDKANDELNKTTGRVQEKQPMLESELRRVTAELKEAEAILPSDFKMDYERVSKARGEDALAQVEGEVCGHCFHMLSPQSMNELLMAKPVFCKSCGSLLYLAEDASP